ncbi:hypothetical protein VTK26DRAFT_5185 [Humicola hyalothermophila]
MSATQSEAFRKAIIDSRKLTTTPKNEDLLEIYALYKVGTGEDFSAATKPGVFDFRAKAKYNAWEKAVQDGLTAEQAQERYVAKIEEMKAEYGYDENKEPEAVGGQ